VFEGEHFKAESKGAAAAVEEVAAVDEPAFLRIVIYRVLYIK
jgi:hypothetical protein